MSWKHSARMVAKDQAALIDRLKKELAEKNKQLVLMDWELSQRSTEGQFTIGELRTIYTALDRCIRDPEELTPKEQIFNRIELFRKVAKMLAELKTAGIVVPPDPAEFWSTSDGRTTPIAYLEFGHLVNIVRKLYRDDHLDHPCWTNLITRLEADLSSRPEKAALLNRWEPLWMAVLEDYDRRSGGGYGPAYYAMFDKRTPSGRSPDARGPNHQQIAPDWDGEATK